MGKKVLIISTSLRSGGNSDTLAEAVNKADMKLHTEMLQSACEIGRSI